MSNKNHYTVTLDKVGDELSVCYWTFDTLEAAKSFLNVLKRGCTAYEVSVSITDNSLNLVEGWRMGDEDQKGNVILNKSQLC